MTPLGVLLSFAVFVAVSTAPVPQEAAFGSGKQSGPRMLPVDQGGLLEDDEDYSRLKPRVGIKRPHNLPSQMHSGQQPLEAQTEFRQGQHKHTHIRPDTAAHLKPSIDRRAIHAQPVISSGDSPFPEGAFEQDEQKGPNGKADAEAGSAASRERRGSPCDQTDDDEGSGCDPYQEPTVLAAGQEHPNKLSDGAIIFLCAVSFALLIGIVVALYQYRRTRSGKGVVVLPHVSSTMSNYAEITDYQQPLAPQQASPSDPSDLSSGRPSPPGLAHASHSNVVSWEEEGSRVAGYPTLEHSRRYVRHPGQEDACTVPNPLNTVAGWETSKELLDKLDGTMPSGKAVMRAPPAYTPADLSPIVESENCCVEFFPQNSTECITQIDE
ncbi:uncharacterized protein LOC135808545 isoform X2 [Sycon ciliatum]|uniref:uncharacterized protein LOC135808545 isoform X2 n=1 Tax=Sycon ciliatum TaxID=27933 RepID=UPI0031F71FBF